MPVCNYDGEVIGVAQIINKRGGEGDNQFTDKDLKVRVITFMKGVNCKDGIHHQRQRGWLKKYSCFAFLPRIIKITKKDGRIWPGNMTEKIPEMEIWLKICEDWKP